MASYYVSRNPQGNGDHEVHTSSCFFLPDSENRTYLGEFLACSAVVNEARNYYAQVNGCYYCSNECHTA